MLGETESAVIPVIRKPCPRNPRHVAIHHGDRFADVDKVANQVVNGGGQELHAVRAFVEQDYLLQTRHACMHIQCPARMVCSAIILVISGGLVGKNETFIILATF